MPAGGTIGNKGGGRHKESDDKIQRFKRVAWDLIVKRCTDKKLGEQWLDRYIPMFASKLMPQQIEGGGENGELLVQLVNYGQTDRLPSSLQLSGRTPSLASPAKPGTV